MGLGNWLRRLGGSSATAVALEASQQESPDEPAKIRSSMGFDLCLEVAGTNTFAGDAVAALADRKVSGERGYFEGQAQLQRDPENPVDPHAVAVLVDGEKVGCLPS